MGAPLAVTGLPEAEFNDWLEGVRADAAWKAVTEFVQWVATSRAYNGSNHHVMAQTLYNDQINAVLPEWAQEWLTIHLSDASGRA